MCSVTFQEQQPYGQSVGDLGRRRHCDCGCIRNVDETEERIQEDCGPGGVTEAVGELLDLKRVWRMNMRRSITFVEGTHSRFILYASRSTLIYAVLSESTAAGIVSLDRGATLNRFPLERFSQVCGPRCDEAKVIEYMASAHQIGFSGK